MTTYATQTDLVNHGLPASALGRLTTAQIDATLASASTYADSFFRARWGNDSVPLITWDSSVTEAFAKIASLRLLRIRGFNPAAASDVEIQKGHDEAVEWLNKVQRQQAHPLVTLATTSSPGRQQPKLISSSVVDVASGRTSGNRGW